MNKKIKLEFKNGEKWFIPLSLIARHRTSYYSKKASKENDETFNIDEEIKFVMNDDYEGIDWLQNNMDYEDFSSELTIVPAKKMEMDFCNAKAEIIGDE